MAYLSERKERKKNEKKNRELLKKMKDKRDLAVLYRKKKGWDERRERAWNYYIYGVKEDLTEASKKKLEERRANYVFSNIEAIVPKMFDRLPGFQVRPRGEDDAVKAPLVEAVLKYKLDTALHLDEHMEDSVRDQLVGSLGILKVCWGYEAENDDEDDDDNDDEKYISYKKDDVEIKVVNPKNFYITAGDTRLTNCEGVFERMIVSIEDAKKKYGKNKNFSADYLLFDVDDDYKNDAMEAGQKTQIWEYHGVIDGKKQVVCFNDNEILDTRDWYEHGRYPYVLLPNYRLPHEFYPLSEVFQIEPLQDEMIEIDTQQSEFRKRAINPKKVVMKGAVDKINMQRLRNPKINVVEVTQPNAIQWEQAALIGQDIYAMRNQRKEDISLMTGQNEISRGGVEETVQTATGQAIINDASQGRIRHKVRVMERALKEILFQVHGLLAQYQDKEERIRITDNKEDPYQKYTKDDIQGSFDFVIDIVESMPLLREKRGQIALQAGQYFAEKEHIDQIALDKKIAKLAFQDINAVELINEPEEAPEEEQVEPSQQLPPPGALPPAVPPSGMPPGMPSGVPPGMPPGMGGMGEQMQQGIPIGL